MTVETMSPLRRRMIEDMTIRRFAPKTQHDYVQSVKNFAAFLGRSPETASFEDVRRYQLHLAAGGAGVPTLNQTVATLRFFFRVTLGRAARAGLARWRCRSDGDTGDLRLSRGLLSRNRPRPGARRSRTKRLSAAAQSRPAPARFSRSREKARSSSHATC
jgi:hypothetical protein